MHCMEIDLLGFREDWKTKNERKSAGNEVRSRYIENDTNDLLASHYIKFFSDTFSSILVFYCKEITTKKF